jgi:hypothetical protein
LISHSDTSFIVDLIELSEMGSRLRVVEGAVPSIGDRVGLTMIDGLQISGTVKWFKDSYIGISFNQPVENIEDRLLFEDLGSSFYRRALVLQKRRRP